MFLQHRLTARAFSVTAQTAPIATFAIQAASANTTATVAVTGSGSSATVPATGYGIGMSVYDNNFTPAGLPSVIDAAGVNALRFPGGSYSDDYHWENGGYYSPGYSIYINANDTFDNWMKDDVIPSGAHAIITCNYGSNETGTGGGDPTEAAAWVKYANVTNNYGVQYWEIGNEVYGNGFYNGSGWELDLHDTSTTGRQGNSALSPTAYGNNILTYISDMKAVSSSIKVGAVLCTPTFWPDGVSPNWNSTVLGLCGTKIDFIICHYYPGGTSIANSLVQPAGIPALVSTLHSLINQYCGSNAPNVKIFITETNDMNGDQSPNTLFAADDYLTWLENGAANVEWQEMHNGFLSQGVTGLADDTPEASYYGLQLASTAARPGDTLVPSSSSNSLMRVHAVHRADGSVAVVLLNEDPSNTCTANVSITGVSLTTSGTQYSFGPSNFSGSSPYTTNGLVKSTANGVGSSFSIAVPAYTESVVIIPAASGGNLVANGTYSILNANGLALDDPGSSTVEGKQMDQATSSGGTNQKWVLTNLGNNVVTLKNSASGYYLDDYGNGTTEGTIVDQWAANGNNNQQWTISAGANGYLKVTNVHSGLVLDVVGNSKASGALVDQWAYNGGNNQLWKFE